MKKTELEELYQRGCCYKTETDEATYYAFSMMKDEHVFAVLKKQFDIDWYKTDVLDLIILETVIKGYDQSYYNREMAKDETVRFIEKKPASYNRSCSIKTQSDEYYLYMDITNVS